MRNMKLKTFVLLGGFIFLGAGCSSTSSVTEVVQESNEWNGEWVMISEIIESVAGELTNPATNKHIAIEGASLIETYDVLEGIGGCTSTGRIVTEIIFDSEDSAHVEGKFVEVDPYLSCGEGAGTTAVPRSLTDVDWRLTREDNQIIATAEYGPSMVTQIYER